MGVLKTSLRKLKTRGLKVIYACPPFFSISKISDHRKISKTKYLISQRRPGALGSNLSKSFGKFRGDASFLLLECFL